jgi:hypothetical protein
MDTTCKVCLTRQSTNITKIGNIPTLLCRECADQYLLEQVTGKYSGKFTPHRCPPFGYCEICNRTRIIVDSRSLRA